MNPQLLKRFTCITVHNCVKYVGIVIGVIVVIVIVAVIVLIVVLVIYRCRRYIVRQFSNQYSI